MKFIKRVSVGQFLEKGVDIKDGDIVTIGSEGKKTEGEYGMQDVFLLKTATKEGNMTFNQTTINCLIDAFGDDSKNWVGKKVKTVAVLSNMKGKMVKVYYFMHPNSELSEDGSFKLPHTGAQTQIENEQPPMEAYENEI